MEQAAVFDKIMDSILQFRDTPREDLAYHTFHLISGPGGTGKTELFRKFHAACRSKGILISICAATTLAALLLYGATTVNYLFSYPVEEEEYIDDHELAKCQFNKELSDLLHEVEVIFWDEYISNDHKIKEALLLELSTRWETPRYYVFVCAGDFAQVC